MISFQENSQRALKNPNLQTAHQRAATHYFKARERSTQGLDLEALREDCRKIRQDSLDHLDRTLLQFEEAFQKRGGIVLWAQDAKEARELVLQICREHGVQKVVKGKSMVTEEIELNAFLEKNGIQALETDLGEYIVQLAGEKPSHLTAPAIHKTREQIATLFHEKLGAPPGLNPEQLVEVARLKLRDQFFKAEAGITGANFLIAETGAIVLVENEGNIGMSTTTPPLHIAVVGMEKVIPRTQDLTLLLRLLARSATGQKMTSYVSLIPQASEQCAKRFVILLDNGRSQMLSDPKMQAALRCIHCGACLNVCPIYQKAGGHSYNSIYPGPIGAIWSPLLFNTPEAHELPFASSLCGACAEVCPVKIPMPHLFLELRHRWVQKRTGLNLHLENAQRAIFSGWAALNRSPFLYRTVLGSVAVMQKWIPFNEKILKQLPVISRWARKRQLPKFATQSFTDWWKNRPSPTLPTHVAWPRGWHGAGDPQARGLWSTPGGSPRTGPARPSNTRTFIDPTRGWDLEERLHRFQDELSQVRGESFVVRSTEELRHHVKTIVKQGPPGPILLAESAAMESIRIREWICDQDSKHFAITQKTIQKKDGLKAVVGITEADCGIAETGTLIFKSSFSSPLVFSLWPRIHIALLSAKRLYGSLEQAFAVDPQISQGHAVMVTGPSRTADIEKTLVLGMHAPQKLYVLITLDSNGHYNGN